MKTISVVLLGVGGYAANHVGHIKELIEGGDPIDIRGIIDPFVKKSPHYDWIISKNYPIYDSLEEFYSKDSASLAVISTPISLHKEQCICAMRHGSDVLVEKPLCATMQDAFEIEKVSRETGKFMAIGFQWSFSEPINALKADILAGKLGKPVSMRSFVSWKRTDVYYHSSWRGRYKDDQGRWTLDCVLTNATAHYLHNLFFVNGDAFNTAAMPEWVKAESYSVKSDMETPDVFAIRGMLPGNVPFWYGCSYSLSGDQITCFEFEFEKAIVRCGFDRPGEHIYAQYKDGSVVDYGNPNENITRKIDVCLAHMRDENVAIPCGIQTVLPHLAVSDGILQKCFRKPLPEELIERQIWDNDEGTFAKSIKDELLYAMGRGLLPSELGFGWASPAVEFKPSEIKSFDGVYPENK